MEGSPYSTIKATFSSVSINALSASSRQILANYLDVTQEFLSEKNILCDYRGLAELVGLTYTEIQRIQEFENRTMRILKSWEICPDATLDKLISFLEIMDRHDVIQHLTPLLERNVESYLKHLESQKPPVQSPEERNVESYLKHLESQKPPIQSPEVTSADSSLSCNSSAITNEDVINKASTVYDAFLSYADEDTGIAQEFANFLKSPPIGLKLCISSRDLLAGCRELDAEIELIKYRCRHMLILLTPNYMKSNALGFQISFARSISIAQKRRILVPVILAPCEIPSILDDVTKIDFTKPHAEKWVMNRLITSLLHEDKVHNFFNSLNESNIIHNSASYEATNSVQFCPYTKSANDSFYTTINSHTYNAIVPTGAIDNENEDLGSTCNFMNGSTVMSEINESRQSSVKPSSNIFEHFLSHLKEKGMISSSSTISHSSSTNGFSQSSSSM